LPEVLTSLPPVADPPMPPAPPVVPDPGLPPVPVFAVIVVSEKVPLDTDELLLAAPTTRVMVRPPEVVTVYVDLLYMRSQARAEHGSALPKGLQGIRQSYEASAQ
jgi:hypothetical protein